MTSRIVKSVLFVCAILTLPAAARAQEAFYGVFQNFPSRILALALRIAIFP